MKLQNLAEIDSNYKVKIPDPLKRDDVLDQLIEFFNGIEKRNSAGIDGKLVGIAYLYGEGGVGKTSICYLLRNEITSVCDRKVVTVYYDLVNGIRSIDHIVSLSSLLKDCFGDPGMFPLFDYTVSAYVIASGQSPTHYWKDSATDGVADIMIKITSCIPVLSAASSMFDAGKSVVGAFQKAAKNNRIASSIQHINSLSREELYGRIAYYFVHDLNTFLERHPELQLLIILDTFESVQYTAKSKDPSVSADWLLGKSGIVRFLKNTFWVLAGREKLSFEDCDNSFKSVCVGKPNLFSVVKYLQEVGLDQKSACAVAEKTNCFPLHFDMCVKLFLKEWNRNVLRSGGCAVEECKPDPDSVSEIIEVVTGSSVLSDRFLSSFTQVEREAIYTLACLWRWTDESLATVIWKDSLGNFTFYEGFKPFSFVKREADGIYEFQCEALSSVIKNCPDVIKRDLIARIVSALDEGSEHSFVLIQSLIHLSVYCQSDLNPWSKVMDYFYSYVLSSIERLRLHSFNDFCDRLLGQLSDGVENCFPRLAVASWQYACALVQNCLYESTSDFHVSNERIEKLCVNLKSALKNLPLADAVLVGDLLQNVCGCLFRYRLNAELLDFLQLFLGAFGEGGNSLLENSEVYRVVFAADGIFYSKIFYYGRSGLGNSESVFNETLKKMRLLYSDLDSLFCGELANYREKILSEYLKLITAAETKIYTWSVSDLPECGELLASYRLCLDKRRVDDRWKLCEAEGLVAFADSFCKRDADQRRAEGIRYILDALHILYSEYGFEDSLLEQYTSLVRWLDYFGNPDDSAELSSFSLLFNAVLSKFCDSYDLKYYRLLKMLNEARNRLQVANSLDERLLEHIEYLRKRKDLRSCLVSLVIYDCCGCRSLCSFREEKGLRFDGESRLLSDLEIELEVGYCASVNCVLYELLCNLENLYDTVTEREKRENLANNLIYFIDRFYDWKGEWRAKSDLFESLFYWFDSEFAGYKNSGVLFSTLKSRDDFDDCFRNLRGWVFYLDSSADAVFVDRSLDLLYKIMCFEGSQCSEKFCELLDTIFSTLRWGRRFTALAENLIRFIKGVKEFNLDISEEVIAKWRRHLPFSFIDGLEDSALKSSLAELDFPLSYAESLVPGTVVWGSDIFQKFEELVREGDPHAKLYYEHFPLVFKDYYEPLLRGCECNKDALLQFIDKMEPKLEQEDTDGKKDKYLDASITILFNCYDLLWSGEEFSAKIRKWFPKLCEKPVFLGETDVLEYIIKTGDEKMIRVFISSALQWDSEDSAYWHLFLIRNYELIEDFVSFEELLVDNLLAGASLDDFVAFYELRTKYLSPERVDSIILNSLSKHLRTICGAGLDDGLDTPLYRWLCSIWGEQTNEKLRSKYPYFVKALELYRDKYSLAL